MTYQESVCREICRQVPQFFVAADRVSYGHEARGCYALFSIAGCLRRASKTRWVKVILTAADDYVVESITSKGAVRASDDGVYCDQLQKTMERQTGLLFGMVRV